MPPPMLGFALIMARMPIDRSSRISFASAAAAFFCSYSGYRDGDGFITAEEFGGSIVQGPMEAPGPDLFGEMDADGNGLLSKVETTAHYNTAGGFAAEDRNSDGVIDWFEFKGPKSEMPPPMGEVNHAEL